MNTNEPINHDDPLFLVSRRLDGDLTHQEIERLEAALETSAALRQEAAELTAVDRLIGARREVGVEIDWDVQRRLVLAVLAEDEGGLDGVDELLTAWGRQKPIDPGGRFADQVLSRIEPRRAHPWRVVARIGAPLAAAAAIAISLTATWFAPMPMPVTDVCIGPLGGPPRNAHPTATVTFVRSEDPVTQPVAIGYMTMGASPLPLVWEESAPL